MSHRHTGNLILALAAACGLSMAAPAAHAQQDASPGPAGGQSGDASAPPNSGGQNAPGPVGGAEQYHLGGVTLGHSFVIPRLSLSELYDSNVGYAATPGASQADEVTSVAGGLTLQWMKRNSTLSLDYSAAGLLYNTQSQSNGVVQQLGLTEKITQGRWNLLLGENFSYLPNSQFGLGGLGLLGGGIGIGGLPGIGGTTGFNPFLVPTQTIVSTNVSQFSSATVLQAQYFVNGKSSLSGSGSVGFLHFFGADLLNSRDITARFGYDRSLTARDTISLSYMASILEYPSGISGFSSHYVQVGYRKILTGRLHLSLSAGPVISHFTPMSGQTTVAGGANLLDWSAFAALDYALRNGGLSVQYNHGIAGGSGFFAGTTADQLNGSFSSHISRVYSASLTGGFARNSSLQQTTQTGPTNNTSTFDTWTAGFSLSRPIGHYSGLRISYNASRQTGNTTVCANGLACGQIALVQIIGVTFNWSTRPIALE